jgi:hypothetical protein
MGTANADAVQKLQQLSAEYNCATAVLNKQAPVLELAHQAAMTHREEAREAVVALAVVQISNADSRSAMLQSRDRICDILSDTQDELNDRFEEISSLQNQLRMMRSQGDE